MGRSAILSGTTQQRDRAKARRRHDRPSAGSSESSKDTALEATIEAIARDIVEIEHLEQLDLREFLQRTGALTTEPADRLRRLAIGLESSATRQDPQPRAWLALDRLYAAAHRLAPEDWVVLHSRGISATECACLWDLPKEVRQRILDAGRRAFHMGLAIDPGNHDLAYSIGQLEYRDPDSPLDEALGWFRKAREGNETPDRGWAQLYIAHCLHDAGRYREAVTAYDAVEPQTFDGPRQWRYTLLREQRAECMLLAGDVDEARAMFVQLLERYEKLAVLDDMLLSHHMVIPAAGALRATLHARVAALARTHGHTWALEQLEQAEASDETTSAPS